MKKYANTDKLEKLTDLRHLQKIAASRYRDKICYVYRRDGKIQSMTFGEHTHIIDALGTVFHGMGLMGGRIALLCESRYEWSATYLAAANGGGCIVPLDGELGPDQLASFMEQAEASAVAYSAKHSADMEAYAKSPGCKVKYFIDMDMDPAQKEKPRNIYSFGALLESGEKMLAEGCTAFTGFAIDPGKMCAILFTSGTTGTSKAVMLSHANIASSVHASVCAVDYDGNDRIMSVLPMHHTYEATCGIFATYALGCEVSINESLRMFSRNFAAYKPTVLVLVPLFVDTMAKKISGEIEKKGKTKLVKRMVRLSNSLCRIGIDLRRVIFKEILDSFGGSLRLIISGGAPLNEAHISMLGAFGIALMQGYGATECSPLISVVPPGWEMKKPGSAGYPVLGVEVKTETLGSGKHGEILAKGGNVMLGYMGDPEATKACMTEDGFYRTGDIGYLDKDGFLYITGRKKNIIVLNNGKNIYPEEIENYLNQSELIGECAVTARNGAGDKTGDAMLCALVYPNCEKLPEGGDIYQAIKKEIEAINKKLPIYKQVNLIEIRETEFEKTTSQKIMREKLR